MTNNTQSGGDFLYGETSAESFIKPTMDIYEALRWIAFGLPPLKSAALEGSFLYDDVLARREEDEGHIPEWVPFNMFHNEEAELKKALIMGELRARGLEDAGNTEDAGWGPLEKDLIDIAQSYWELFERWNYQQPYSRVDFGFCGWYGHVQFKTDAVIALFPISSRVHRDCVGAENDIYQYCGVSEVSEVSKTGRPKKDKTPVYKRIIILAMAGKFDTYLNKPRCDNAIYSVIAEDLSEAKIPLGQDTIRKDYGVDDLIKAAREMREKQLK
ncbi:hypothetical protein [Thalassospira profundimaris]|uniref:hypothetical protein n=1 Tax=Thalassospira profundimaris TaxID=502049 RepID=UPI0002873528|nr:hypothetical protein [Thalassospira profundimaris]EKF09411.1 hypothetical protein TH2_05953 [Thalassospira profundimaris WP0211]